MADRIQITANGTFTPIAKTFHMTGLMYNVSGTPTGLVLKVQDGDTPAHTILNTAAIGAPTNAPVVVPLTGPGITMYNGINIITSGASGSWVLDVWINQR